MKQSSAWEKGDKQGWTRGSMDGAGIPELRYQDIPGLTARILGAALTSPSARESSQFHRSQHSRQSWLG